MACAADREVRPEKWKVRVSCLASLKVLDVRFLGRRNPFLYFGKVLTIPMGPGSEEQHVLLAETVW